MNIREMKRDEIQRTLALVLTGYHRLAALDYTQEGVDTFYRLLQDSEAIRDAEFFGAFEGREFLGVVAVRQHRSHICFFFVEEERKNRNIGRQLFEHLLQNSEQNTITVNSAPYAVDLYRSLGFTECDRQQVRDGTLFTPMKYEKRQ